MFINLSNHPSSKWDSNQYKEAVKYGEVVDISFPAISSDATEEEVYLLVKQYVDIIVEKAPSAVMCQGEYTFTYGVVNELMKHNIVCLSACTKREVVEHIQEDGSILKESVFRFSRFRRYFLQE